jgi:hypothetical protein
MIKDGLLTTVNYLVTCANVNREFEMLNLIVPLLNKLGNDVRFVHNLAILNPFLDLALEDREKYERVMELVRQKRSVARLSTPEIVTTRVTTVTQSPQPEDEQAEENGTTEYQRLFMQQKRDRERRAAAIENLMRPEKDQLRGRARLNFMSKVAAEWKQARDRALAAERARVGASLTREEMREVLRVFWEGVDRELDELEKLARQERHGKLAPAH